MITIRSGIGMIPGGVQFTDPRVSSMKWLDDHTWVNERVREVQLFRLSNPKIYPPTEDDGKWLDQFEIEKEIVKQNCDRLENNPNWCHDGTSSMRNVDIGRSAPLGDRKCTCGVMMIPRYSACCGHSVGWDCPACGKVI